MKVASVSRSSGMLLFAFHTLFTAQTWAGEEEFNQLQYKLESDVLELRQAVEDAYQNRCNPSTLQSCHRSSYDACSSAFPNPVCLAGEGISFDVCSDDCGSIWDYSISNAYFPPFPGSREDPAVLEDLCFSRSVDTYFAEKTNDDRAYWANYEIESPSMHIGMESGAFRLYPGRANATCGSYDPRVRPWYVAGSSGPKNVVLLLDISGSMDGIRLYFLKQAAIRIIDTLTVGDRIAIVPFSTTAQAEYFDGEALVKVTSSIKGELKRRVHDLQAVGATNFYDAFRRAFQVMEDSIPLELVVDCNTALLFLTDGKMTDPPAMEETQVLEFVHDGLAQLEERLSHPVHLFSYSISENDDVHTFPKELACATTDKGIWSKVIDEHTIVDSLSSYSNLFSMGLGEGRNDDFVAWVEPYQFSTRGEAGVTISAPVFDRSVTPAVLIGVVGIDLLVEALDRALGVETGSSETYDRIVLSSTAKCPRLETSQCQMEAFRSIGIGGEEARCGVNANCSLTDDFTTSTTCANQDDLPSNILANTDSQDKLFVERACCTPTIVGADGSTTAPPFVPQEEDVCVTESLAKYWGESDDSKNLAAIIGGSVGGFVAFIAGLGLFLMWMDHRRGGGGKDKATNRTNNRGESSTPVIASASAIPEEGPVPMAVSTFGDPLPVPQPEASAPLSPRLYTIGHKEYEA